MTPTPCPICGAPGGFHDQGPHTARLVPPELAYTKQADGVWLRPDGLGLPHLCGRVPDLADATL